MKDVRAIGVHQNPVVVDFVKCVPAHVLSSVDHQDLMPVRSGALRKSGTTKSSANDEPIKS
jgi:hypothetical protein